jgi:hypothetical protein
MPNIQHSESYVLMQLIKTINKLQNHWKMFSGIVIDMCVIYITAVSNRCANLILLLRCCEVTSYTRCQSTNTDSASVEICMFFFLLTAKPARIWIQSNCYIFIVLAVNVHYTEGEENAKI